MRFGLVSEDKDRIRGFVSITPFPQRCRGQGMQIGIRYRNAQR
jgi:hypothetical protein